MELWQYSGEPTEEEILHRLEFWKSWSVNGYKDNHLRIHPRCPNCDSNEDTEWLRQEWSVCYACMIAFDSLVYYDTEAYKQDDRTPEEVLEYIEQGGK